MKMPKTRKSMCGLLLFLGGKGVCFIVIFFKIVPVQKFANPLNTISNGNKDKATKEKKNHLRENSNIAH